jgi:hypothetical protein
MATWHQYRGGGLLSLYAPELRFWKVIVDRPNELACAITFRRKDPARRYARRVAHAQIVAPLLSPQQRAARTRAEVPQ